MITARVTTPLQAVSNAPSKTACTRRFAESAPVEYLRRLSNYTESSGENQHLANYSTNLSFCATLSVSPLLYQVHSTNAKAEFALSTNFNTSNVQANPRLTNALTIARVELIHHLLRHRTSSRRAFSAATSLTTFSSELNMCFLGSTTYNNGYNG
ncbi:hypothetical protein CI102_7929 [Trichoderma harzianum]|nr:hypothetical protein CI102_7929 [Trichoderma harzianum]